MVSIPHQGYILIPRTPRIEPRARNLNLTLVRESNIVVLYYKAAFTLVDMFADQSAKCFTMVILLSFKKLFSSNSLNYSIMSNKQ